MTAPTAGSSSERTVTHKCGWQVRTVRPHACVTLLEVRLSNYEEYFFVAVGEKSVSITMLDPSDPMHREPQTFVFAKPYEWNTDLEGDEALLQVWQAIGTQR
jgi:hypothetical protein